MSSNWIGRSSTNSHQDAEEAIDLQNGTKSPNNLMHNRPSGALGWLWEDEEADEQRRRLKNRDDKEAQEQRRIKDGEDDTEQATDLQDDTSLPGKLRHNKPSGALGWLWRDKETDEQHKLIRDREGDIEQTADFPDETISPDKHRHNRPSGALGWLWRDKEAREKSGGK